MSRIVRAIVIRNKILRSENENWDFKLENGMNIVSIVQSGWSALLWGRSTLAMLNEKLEVDRDIFLNECRKQNCPHTLELWVDGLGRVLSTSWDRMEFKVVNLTRGTWETRFFGLPMPKSRKSPYYGDLGAKGRLAGTPLGKFRHQSR